MSAAATKKIGRRGKNAFRLDSASSIEIPCSDKEIIDPQSPLNFSNSDLELGVEVTSPSFNECFDFQARTENKRPMSPVERRLLYVKQNCCGCCGIITWIMNHLEVWIGLRENVKSEEAFKDKNQYTVVERKKDFGRYSRMLQFLVSLNCSTFINECVYNLLEWTFTTSFQMLICMFVVAYTTWVVSFAYLIWLSTSVNPQCISSNKHYWQDAFALSWTTFSTVGYGHVYPTLAEKGEAYKCGFIISLTAIEAYVGILYVSCCGALLFSKILRVQAEAPVRYSNALVVDYSNLLPDNRARVLASDGANKKVYPELQLRVVNNLANSSGAGELMDANVRIVMIEKDSDNEEGTILIDPRRLSKKSKRRSSKVSNFKAMGTAHDFSDVAVSNKYHPLFNRTWIINHTLNEKSPLVKESVKKMIKKNKGDVGGWPSDICEPKHIRDALVDFKSLVVSINAVSNSSATMVYSYNIFGWSSVVIGYKFAKMNFIDPRSNDLIVDFSLLNDIVEQGPKQGGLSFSKDDQEENTENLFLNKNHVG